MLCRIIGVRHSNPRPSFTFSSALVETRLLMRRGYAERTNEQDTNRELTLHACIKKLHHCTMCDTVMSETTYSRDHFGLSLMEQSLAK